MTFIVRVARLLQWEGVSNATECRRKKKLSAVRLTNSVTEILSERGFDSFINLFYSCIPSILQFSIPIVSNSESGVGQKPIPAGTERKAGYTL